MLKIRKIGLFTAVIALSLIWSNGLASAVLCYQEFANVSTSCGGLSSGEYSDNTPGRWGNWLMMIDGDWTTYSGGATYGAVLLINYTIPPRVLINSSLIRVRYGSDVTPTDANFSIPQECQNRTDNKILLKDYWFFSGTVKNEFYCFNRTGGEKVIVSWVPGAASIYEEAMWWDIPVFTENSVTYNAIVYETSKQNFILNLSYNSADYLAISAEFIYNNTIYSAESAGTGDNILFNSELETPLVSTAINKTFYWRIGLLNNTGIYYYNSSFYNQTVNPVYFDECNSSMTTTSINFSAYDENSLTMFKNSTNGWDASATINYWIGDGINYKTVSVNRQNITTLLMCLSQNLSYKLSGFISYKDTAGTYTSREYHFINDVMTNNVTNISLILLPDADSTTFIQKVQDVTQIAMPNTYIITQKYYPSINEYKTVQISKTGADGKTVGFYKTETIFYSHILKNESGSILHTQSMQKIFAESAPYTLTFTVGSSDSYPGEILSDLSSFSFSLAKNSTTKIITYTYQDTSVLFINSSLIVDRIKFAAKDERVCNSTSAQASSVLTCNLSAYDFDSFRIKIIVNREDAADKIVKITTFEIDDAKALFGKYGLFLAYFIILVAACSFIFNPSVGIIATEAAIIFVRIIGLARFSITFIFATVALAIIALIAFNNSNRGFG